MIFLKKVYDIISDMRLSLAGLAVYAVLLGTATVLEKYYGIAVARIAVYNNPMFYVLQALLIVSFAAVAVRLKLLRRGRYGSIVIHSALAVILCGALITSLCGEEGTIHLREGETATAMETDDGGHKALPYSLTLNKFNVEYYAGSAFPSAYSSYVTVRSNGNAHDAEISMNKILRVDGHRVYQSSYDSDMKGTILTVNTDFWGTAVTYTGYLLLLAGFILSLAGKNSRIRDILKQLSSDQIKRLAAVSVLICGASVLNASAEEMPQRYVIPAEQAVLWERISVQNGNGRIEPLECYSRSLFRKLSHSGSVPYTSGGATLLMSIICYPDFWSTVPLIYCNDDELKWRLGLKGEGYIAYNDLFDAGGNYKLAALASSSGMSEQNGNLAKSMQKLDEKVKIFYSILDRSALRLFPVSSGEKWVAPYGDLRGLPGKDSVFVSTVIPLYVMGVIANDSAFCSTAIDHISGYQTLNAPAMVPSAKKTTLAIFYSRANIFWISGLGYLASGLLLAFMAFRYIRRMTFMRRVYIGAVEGVIIAFFLLHTMGIALRWYVSGQPPWSNTYETMVYVAWAMLLAGAMFMRYYPLVTALATLMGGVTLMISNLNWLDPAITPLMPVLNSPWLMLHVTVITASYGFFGICALLGLMSMGLSLAKRPDGMLVRQLSLINELSAYIGLVLVTAGTFLGAVWANLSWGRYWGWDAKETWALVTIIVYTFITHMRLVPSLRGDTLFSVASVYALLSVLMTYFGVNHYLTGLHSYGTAGTTPGVGAISAFYALVTVAAVVIAFKRKRGIRITGPDIK